MIGVFEGDRSLRELFVQDARVLHPDSVYERLVDAMKVLDNMQQDLQAISQPVLAGKRSGNDSRVTDQNDIVLSSEVTDLNYWRPLLALLLGEKVLRLAEAMPPTGRAFAASQVRRWLARQRDDQTDAFMGIDRAEWYRAVDSFESVAADAPVRREGVPRSDQNGGVSYEPLARINRDLEHYTALLVKCLLPGSGCTFPEKWWRSYSGVVAIPQDASHWPDLKAAYMHLLPPSLGIFTVLAVNHGLVSSAHSVNAGERHSLTPLRRLRGRKSTLVNAIAEALIAGSGYGESFIKFFGGYGASRPEDAWPLDTIFMVDESGSITVVYRRPELHHSSFLPSLGKLEVSATGILDPGFYMLKAGKDAKSGHYSAQPPLALIELNAIPEESLAGAAFIAGGFYRSNDRKNALAADDEAYLKYLGFADSSVLSRPVLGKSLRVGIGAVPAALRSLYGLRGCEFDDPFIDQGGKHCNYAILLNKRGMYALHSIEEAPIILSY